MQREGVEMMRGEPWWSPVHERLLEDDWITAAEMQEADYILATCLAEAAPGVPFHLTGQAVGSIRVGDENGLTDQQREIHDAAVDEINACWHETAFIRWVYEFPRTDPETLANIGNLRNCLAEIGWHYADDVSDMELNAFIWNDFADDETDLFRENHPDAAECRDKVFGTWIVP